MLKLLPFAFVLLVSAGCAHENARQELRETWNGKATLKVERPNKTTVSYKSLSAERLPIETLDKGLACVVTHSDVEKPERFLVMCTDLATSFTAGFNADCVNGPKETNFAITHKTKPYFMEFSCKDVE